MADEAIGSEHRSVGQRVKRSVETHVLVPLAVTVVSAATHYLIKKLPLILEEKVLPKLREQGGAEGVRGSTVAETAAAVTERVAEVVPAVEGGESAPTTSRPKRRKASSDEREQERKQREQRRGERRRAVQKA